MQENEDRDAASSREPVLLGSSSALDLREHEPVLHGDCMDPVASNLQRSAPAANRADLHAPDLPSEAYLG